MDEKQHGRAIDDYIINALGRFETSQAEFQKQITPLLIAVTEIKGRVETLENDNEEKEKIITNNSNLLPIWLGLGATVVLGIVSNLLMWLQIAPKK